MNPITPSSQDYDDLARRLTDTQRRSWQIQEKLLAQVVFWRFMALGLLGVLAAFCLCFRWVPKW